MAHHFGKTVRYDRRGPTDLREWFGTSEMMFRLSEPQGNDSCSLTSWITSSLERTETQPAYVEATAGSGHEAAQDCNTGSASSTSPRTMSPAGWIRVTLATAHLPTWAWSHYGP